MTDRAGEAALERALTDKDLLLFYQPIHDARTGRITGAEALLRQRRSTGEIREASIITEAAEDAAGPELYALDAGIMGRAFHDAAAWQRHAPKVMLNVNLSPREFETGDIVPRLSRLIADAGVDPGAVALEITETSYIKDPEATVGTLEAIRASGVGLWLDDFGTQFSSMMHVLHFPLNGLKLPAEFVKGIVGDDRSMKIVRSLIGLARDLGLLVIAEGVEKTGQRERLLDLGCPLIQGFLFSKPMPLAEFQKTVSAR